MLVAAVLKPVAASVVAEAGTPVVCATTTTALLFVCLVLVSCWVVDRKYLWLPRVTVLHDDATTVLKHGQYLGQSNCLHCCTDRWLGGLEQLCLPTYVT